MNKFLSIALACVASLANAQTHIVCTNIWNTTNNAAGIGRDTIVSFGQLTAAASHTAGDFHRVQDGGTRNDVSFSALRYQKAGKYIVVKGMFDFNAGRTKDRAWCDVMRPYESNPFISGSSVKGKYDHLMFSLNGQVATIPLRRLTYGIGLDYNVGDLSRLRDPRSRVQLANYRITPSITIALTDSSVLGFEWHYNRRKEKLLSLTTVQSDPNLEYYVMTGLENAVGTIGGYNGYSRQYVSHRIGSELSYRLKHHRLTSLNAVAYEGEVEYVTGSYKYEPGRFFSRKGTLMSENRIVLSSNDAHQLSFLRVDMHASHTEAYADEYKQELITTKDAITGIDTKRWHTLIRYSKRYQLQLTDVDARLCLGRSEMQHGIENQIRSIAIAAHLYDANSEHVVSDSYLTYRRFDVAAEGNIEVLPNTLGVSASVGYSFACKANLVLADESSAMAQAVLLPDMDVISSDAIPLKAAITYSHSMLGNKLIMATLSGNMLRGNSQSRNSVAFSIAFRY